MRKKLPLFLFVCLGFSACTPDKTSEQSGEVKKDSTANTATKEYKITAGNVTLQIDPETGARISSLKINEEELLYLSKDSNNNNWGSTFWPGPQKLWGWPPPSVLDSEPFKDSTVKEGLAFVSNISVKPVLQFSKEFSGGSQDTSVRITYTITNKGDSSIQLVPWEITRVPPGGIVFYPKGKGKSQGDLAKLVHYKEGIAWFDYDSTTIPQGVPKVFEDGSEGWVAYVNNTRKILIKTFEDTPLEQKAPEENEVHIYTDPNKKYTEVEHQGAYTLLEPGKSLSWTVKWYVRELPARVQIQEGSPTLAAFVRNVVK